MIPISMGSNKATQAVIDSWSSSWSIWETLN